MATATLNEIQQRLHAVNIPVRLDEDAAMRMKEAQPRDRILAALNRVEQHQDVGARRFLENLFQEVGAYVSVNSGNANNPQNNSASDVSHVQQGVGSHSTSEAPRSPHNASEGNTQEQRVGERDYGPSHHIYGGKAAIMFESDITAGGAHTVVFDAAKAIGERKFDWGNKIRIQLTRSELPRVAAVFLGVLSEVKFGNHGPKNNKGFSITWQGDRSSFFIQVYQGKGNACALPVSQEDAFYVAQFFVDAIQKGSPATLDTIGVMTMLKALYARH